MWETFISWYINNYLGQYVENLNSQQLSFALSQGELELENVPLKKNIFRSWGLPVEVKSGVVGRIKIEFNILKYFRNEPVLISIDDIFLVAGPCNLAEWDPFEEEALARETKMSALDAHESRWKAQFDLASNSSSYYSSLYVSSMRIGASIVTKVVENLQLNVHNVHIRFEQEIGKSNRIIAFGVTLHGLSVQSCDSEWNPLSTSGNNTSDCSFKTLQVNKLGVYCDTKAEKLSHLSPHELKAAMWKHLPQHDYLLTPVSAEAKITKNNSIYPLSSTLKPRFDVHLTLDRVPLQLSDAQYKYSYRLYKSVKKLDRNCRLRHYRPFTNIHEHVQEWWIYATQAVLSLRGFKRRNKLKTWDEVLARARDNVKYVKVYYQYLAAQLLSTEDRKLKDQMEMELHFEDIIELRKIVMSRIERHSKFKPDVPKTEVSTISTQSTEETTGETIKPARSGLMSWIFPSWGDWSTPPSTNKSDVVIATDTQGPKQERGNETDFDEAILGEMKAFDRDALLAQFNFILKQGVILLSRKNGPFLELDFGGVAVQLSLKPRSGSHKFQMSLANLVLRDCVTKSSVLAPHSANLQKHFSIVPEPLFNVIYEMKPHKKSGHRVTVSTKPMDLILYPLTWDEVGNFFSVQSEEDYLETPYNGYEAMKQKTKEELRVYWERLVNQRNSGDSEGNGGASWEIYMDIFAPQIIIYGSQKKQILSKGTTDHMTSKTRHESGRPSRLSSRSPHTTSDMRSVPESFLVIDLGRFKFTNIECDDRINSPDYSKNEDKEVSDDENEEFHTPCSSPAPEPSEIIDNDISSRPSMTDLNEIMNRKGRGVENFGDSLNEIHAKLYKKYTLEITDVQVIVVDGKAAKDNTWKAANLKTTSFLHLIDRFSINLQLERRLVYSEDPLWPALTLVGTLPKLTFHLNEFKVVTVRSVLNAFATKEVIQLQEPVDFSFLNGSQINLQDGEKSEYKIEEHFDCRKSVSKLFVAEFTIQSVSVDLQACGRNIAELQIVGTKTVFTRREDDTEFSFVIQSLLLADAVQTFGPDFQLLLASHRHVCMDTISGSLRDSEPTSPMSPVSPPSPMPSAYPRSCASTLSIPSQLHDALVSSLQTKKKKTLSSVGSQTPIIDSNALITVDVVITNKEEDLAIITVQFNNLDVIANQETIVEILQFLQNIFPSKNSNKVQPKSSEASIIPSNSGRKIQANFEFHRLNILLLRGVVGKDGQQIAKKIATATASEARVNCVLHAATLNVDGSLGGLQVLNLTPEGQRHQRILSVGQDPLVDATYHPFSHEVEVDANFLFQPGTNESALTFSYERIDPDGNARGKAPTVILRMASVIYSHCSLFLADLKKCINQFQTPLATTLKSAATHIALGLVRQEGTSGVSFGYRSPLGSLSGSLDRIDIDEGPSVPNMRDYNNIVAKLDIVLDSPILVLPRSRDSPEVLVAHLGQISITSSNPTLLEDFGENNRDNSARCSTPGTPKVVINDGTIGYNVFICDISLYSLNLKSRWRMMENLKMTYPSSSNTTLMRAQDLYKCDSVSSIPILHNTVIQFNVFYMEDLFDNDDAFGGSNEFYETNEGSGSRLEVQGRVISSLKVSLTPQQYSLLLDSVTNVASVNDEDFGEISYIERRINWQKEKSSFNKKGSSHLDPAPLPSPTRSYEDALLIFSCFEVPELIVELVLPEGSFPTKDMAEVPHLSLSCSDLSFKCDKKCHSTEMDICLKALKLEDTNSEIDSWRRILAKSKTMERGGGEEQISHSSLSVSRPEHLSNSCPDLQKSTSPVSIVQSPSLGSDNSYRMESSSLPEELDPKTIFRGRYFQSKVKHSKYPSQKRRMSIIRCGSVESRTQICPVTPPPSPRPDDKSSENLVQIQIIMVDTKSPNFMTDYGGNHKKVKVDFNTLEVLLIPDTFACLRKFFSDASKDKKTPAVFSESSHNVSNTTFAKTTPSTVVDNSSFDDRNTETIIKVKALTVKLAKAKSYLAEAKVSSVSCEIKSRGKDYFGVEGRLGSLKVKDISSFCGLYPVKFVFQGNQALDFDYARTGLDGKFRLTMSSIVCVHTHRFYSEFSSLWQSIFGQSAVDSSTNIESQTAEVSNDSNTRVILDIQAGAPVILLPYSSTSEKVLVADLGHLSVRNKFVEDASKLILNLISVDLIQMDLYSGELVQMNSISSEINENAIWSLHKGWAVIKTLGVSSFLQKQCALSLKVRRVFQGFIDDSVAATRVQGVLSTVYCTIDPEKYKLIRGLLAHNIGEQNIENIQHSTTSYTESHRNLSKKYSTSSNSAKVELNIELDLVNVTLEVVQQNGAKISRVDFIKSRFTFQNSSDGSKDVDLASQEILVCDSRYEGKESPGEMKNIFTNILQQSIFPHTSTGAGPSSHQPDSSTFHSNVHLQAEIHFRQTHRGSNVTIVLNNMRLMLILDWWMEILAFLSQEIPNPPKLCGSSSHLSQDENADSKQRHASPLLERSREQSSPVTVSAGIVTKRAPVLDVPESSFELKVNVSNCELVVVEKASVWDTNAIILKSTAVMGYRPHLERPISCSLLQCELFSCILGLESETALSILDPTNIQLELVRQSKSEPQGILDATFSLASSGKILRIQSPSLSLRLSYHDMKMFVRLMDKFSKEAQLHFRKTDSTDSGQTNLEIVPTNFPEDYKNIGQMDKLGLPFDMDCSLVDKLVAMGFSADKAIDALEETRGSLEDAIYVLTKHRTSPEHQNKSKMTTQMSEREGFELNLEAECRSPDNSSDENGINGLSGIEIKCNCFSLCVIDDCKDSDVPLVELSVQQLELSQNCIENLGSADCVLSGDYYNRALSGWEPFLEPWKCNLKWKKNLIGQLDDYSPSSEFPSRAPEHDISLSSRMVMEINLTSTLLNLYKTVLCNWTEDYQQQKIDKRRAPFVPFALRNETGSTMWFCTILSNNEELIKQQKTGGNYFSDGTGWIEVSHGGVQTFSFEGRGKLRHRNTHQLRTHQLAVRVDGWHEVTPISVDKVGTYFRVARPEATSRRYGAYMELPPTRLVLEVSLQGSAQKLVTVRSALMIKNELLDPVELKLENTIVYPSFERAQTGGSYIVQVKPGQMYPVPLHSVWAHMWIRPIIPDAYPFKYLYCDKALLVGSSQEGLRECTARAPEQTQPYRFCVAVKRNEFPADGDDMIPQNSLPNIVQLMSTSKRANLVTLVSPFKIVNLLPHEISFEVKGQLVQGHISAGKDKQMTSVDISEPFEIHIQVDNFPQGMVVAVNPKVNSFVARVRIQDTQKRTLVLNAKTQIEEGGVLAVLLCCPCWVVNKSGLPLLCKQEGTTGEAAGQFQEHEVGRLVTPLMMSFPDQEGSEALTFRVGTGLHKNSKPFWCRSFICQNGTRVRKLTVSHCNNTPESVYMVGIDIKNGTGRYRDTKVVIVSPRFIVDNRSSCKIQISQRAYATSFFDAKAEATHLTLPAGCNLPFHWPRLDKEQLLCVRLKDDNGSSWSGGFPVDNIDSFHINIRNKDGNCHFLRVEIVIQGPSYFVIFSDTIQLPPPFRVDNFSLVPLIFHQACIGEERLKISARSESSLPYVLDEPTQPPHLTIAAPGGSSVIVNMDELRYVTHLTYENFFYIGFTATFGTTETGCITKTGMESLQLVLDVPEGTKVVLSKKEPGKRSQLWRVNADGLIEHEGSSPPRDGRKNSFQEGTMLVLDIAGSAPLPNQCVPLMLRKPDKRRISTQHWEFTSDGRLKCRMYESLYVQAKDGFGGMGAAPSANGKVDEKVGIWQLWRDVVLGPSQPICYIRTDSGIPAEQAIARQKLRPGSGTLNLAVETDGPTRVLRIIDVEHPPRHYLLHHTFEENDYNTTPLYRIKVDLQSGLGVSVISCNPREELLYGRFSGFFIEWTDTKNSQILKASVMNLQIDNQLLESEKSAAIYVATGSRSETVEDFSIFEQQPALHLYWESMKSKLNARVFKVWELVVKPLALIIEERLLLKLSTWLGFGQQIQTLDMLQQSDFEVQKALTSTASLTTRRYYFGMMKIILSQVRLSVLTTSKLPPNLAAVKRRLGLTLIRFEDANVELDPFEKHHPFETFEFLWAMIVKHYRDELVSQAAVILGSTDFLGNPLGFVNDVSEGVSMMIYEGSVGALVKNVAHGLSNSAAKVTGTLGEGLGRTILDDKHEEERRRIKEDHAGSSGEYLYAGLKGFGHGLVGGVTSVVTQSYEGAANEGFTGLFTGLTKGIVGTITKPAVGILDLATGAASAIRDSSKTSSRMMPNRVRPTRVVIGNGGLLPVYSEAAARGQELLFDLNDRNYNELFIGYEILKSGPNQDLRIMISSEAVTIFRPGKGNPVILKVPLSELVECQISPSIGGYEKNPFIELVRKLPDMQAPCRPQVVCDYETVAKRVVQHINYAKVLYEEMRHSQIGNSNSGEE